MAINRNDWIDEVKQDAYGPTGNPAKLSTASGSAPSYSARAWVNFNGSTGAINASGNVTSITKNSTGDYTINFTTPMSSANYCVSISSGGASVGGDSRISQTIVSLSTTSARIRITRNDGAAVDSTVMGLIVIE